MSEEAGQELSEGEGGSRSPAPYEPYDERAGSLGGYGSARASRSPGVSLRPGGNACSPSASYDAPPLPEVPTQFDEEPAVASPAPHDKNVMVVTPGTRPQPGSRPAASHKPLRTSLGIRRTMT